MPIKKSELYSSIWASCDALRWRKGIEETALLESLGEPYRQYMKRSV